MRRFLCFLCLFLCVTACAPSAWADEIPDVPVVFLKANDPLPIEPILTIYCLDLRGCDGFVILCGGQSMLVDSGRQNRGEYVVGTLRALGVERLNIAFNTHPDIDHCGGFYTVLKQMPVDVLCHGFRETENEYQIKLLKIARENDVPVRLLENGDTITLGDALIQVYQYMPELYVVNNHSLITHVSLGDAAFLNPADISRVIQIILGDEYGRALNAQIFKMPHHGYDTVASALMNVVSPKLCILTSSKSHNEKTRKQLDKLKIPYYRDNQGPIRMCTDGTMWTVQLIEPLVK